jgi:multiple sugar transport system substrate-binding protein
LFNSTTEFAAGRVGFYFGPSWRIFDIQALNPDLKFTINPLPQLPIDPVHGESLTTWATYWAEAVNRKSANSQIAWELLKFLSSSEIQTKFYQSALGSPRAFGEPYSRVDMSPALASDPWVGPFINQAPLAKSWYLASFTKDGPSGINSRFSDLYSQAINGEIDLETLSNKIGQVLSEYGISASAPSQ